MRRLRPTFSAALPHVGTYTRELPISLERMYENALDGEHLPWLHSTSFSELDITNSGPWGWAGTGYLFPKSFTNKMGLELRLDKDKHRWITTTTSGLGKGTEIWTHAIALEDHKIKIIVDFYVPKLPKFLKNTYAKQLISTYAILYDEDLWMMSTRQNELDRLKAGKALENVTELELGPLAEIENSLPHAFSFNNNPYILTKLDGEFIAFSATCPHMLGPLDKSEIKNGAVECPWHGYQFDIKSRKCISGAKCKLAPAPSVRVDDESGIISVSI